MTVYLTEIKRWLVFIFLWFAGFFGACTMVVKALYPINPVLAIMVLPTVPVVYIAITRYVGDFMERRHEGRREQ
jgi:drug/metabolite transporter (DMT)-like permease